MGQCHYFSIPYYKDLQNPQGWERKNPEGTRYFVSRAFFRMNYSQLSEKSKYGRKLCVISSPKGVKQILKEGMELQIDLFLEEKSIRRSIIESGSMEKTLNELSTTFGDGEIINFGGKASSELSRSIKSSFQNDFRITCSQTHRSRVYFEFISSFDNDLEESFCGVAVYQRSRIDLYLLHVDFLNVEYRRRPYSFRRERFKSPPPENQNKKANIIQCGIPLMEINYWELLPKSSRFIKEVEYKQEVENETEIEICSPRSELKERPYWGLPKSDPSLYALSNKAFKRSWKEQKNRNQFTMED